MPVINTHQNIALPMMLAVRRTANHPLTKTGAMT